MRTIIIALASLTAGVEAARGTHVIDSIDVAPGSRVRLLGDEMSFRQAFRRQTMP